MATSIFSHQSITHLAFNSIALYSFGSAAYTFLAQQDPQMIHLPSSTSAYHFLAFFLAAGLASSLGSHLTTVLFRLPRLLRSISTSSASASISSRMAAERTFLPSLGASGAIYGALTMTALAYPDASVSLIFLPMVPIPIGVGMGAMVLVDALGVIRGWQ